MPVGGHLRMADCPHIDKQTRLPVASERHRPQPSSCAAATAIDDEASIAGRVFDMSALGGVEQHSFGPRSVEVLLIELISIWPSHRVVRDGLPIGQPDRSELALRLERELRCVGPGQVHLPEVFAAKWSAGDSYSFSVG